MSPKKRFVDVLQGECAKSPIIWGSLSARRSPQVVIVLRDRAQVDCVHTGCGEPAAAGRNQEGKKKVTDTNAILSRPADLYSISVVSEQHDTSFFPALRGITKARKQRNNSQSLIFGFSSLGLS